MKSKFILIAALMLSPKFLLAQPPIFPDVEDIKKSIEIAAIVAKDQAIRFEILNLQKKFGTNLLNTHPEVLKLWNNIDKENLKETKKILNNGGWPNVTTFSKEYNHNIFLLVQHADTEPKFQQQFLNFLNTHLAVKKSMRSEAAYLYDRIQVNLNLPQKYGTQGKCIKPGLWQPFKIENIQKIDQFRHAVGLNSFLEYKQITNKYCY